MHSLITAGPISDSGPWTLGVLIGGPVLALILLGLIAFALFAASDGKGGIAAGSLFFAIVLVALAASPIGYYPYNSEYHQWRSVSGEVQDVSSRLIGGDKTVSQRFVVKIDGQAFGVDDTRASLLKKGDTVSLRCKREWQYAAESGWACRWGGTR